jgi:hypothetical protein
MCVHSPSNTQIVELTPGNVTSHALQIVELTPGNVTSHALQIVELTPGNVTSHALQAQNYNNLLPCSFHRL